MQLADHKKAFGGVSQLMHQVRAMGTLVDVRLVGGQPPKGRELNVRVHDVTRWRLEAQSRVPRTLLSKQVDSLKDFEKAAWTRHRWRPTRISVASFAASGKEARELHRENKQLKSRLTTLIEVEGSTRGTFRFNVWRSGEAESLCPELVETEMGRIERQALLPSPRRRWDAGM